MEDELMTKKKYQTILRERATIPEGFKVRTGTFRFFPKERLEGNLLSMGLTVVNTLEPTPMFGGVYTSNRFPGTPVIVGKELMNAPVVSGMVINTKIANVGVAGSIEDAKKIMEEAKKIFAQDAPLFPFSTGVIGWSLPVDEMVKEMRCISGKRKDSSLVRMAQNIMTTDRYPKIYSATVGNGRIAVIGKGAGMVEPHLATMLVFILTDIAIERVALRELLCDTVDGTFNCITIDGEQSTSDSVFMISSGKKREPLEKVGETLKKLCANMAEEIVRNGEGVRHVIEVTVKGAPNKEAAVACGRRVLNAPLTKTAIAGNDPNTGRILQAIGDCADREDISLVIGKLNISIGKDKVFKNGSFIQNQRLELSLIDFLESAEQDPHALFPFNDRKVPITIDLGIGKAEATLVGADLTKEYVSINADYRS